MDEENKNSNKDEKNKSIFAMFMQAVRNIIFILGLFVVVGYVNDVLEVKESRYKYEPFYAQEEDFDVLFFGASHVRLGVYPMDLWNEYGIVSYNFGGEATEIPVSYWNMKNALEHTNPKLVVLDVSGITRDFHISNIESVHKEFDHMPLTKTKVQAMMDLFTPGILARKTDGTTEYDRRWELIWNMQLYHSRWDALTEADFDLDYTTFEKGAEMRGNVADPVDFKQADRDDYTEYESICVDYLKRFVEDCKEQDIEVLLIYIPGTIAKKHQRNYNYVYKLAEECGVNYVNFMNEDVVDFNTDLYDSSTANNHLNVSGGTKLSAWLGSYIMENYDIPDRREDDAYDSWFEDYDRYLDGKLELMRKETNIYSYMAYMTEDDFDYCIRIKRGSSVLSDDKAKNLIQNFSRVGELKRLTKTPESSDEYFFIIDNGGNTIYESDKGAALNGLETSFGDISYGVDADGKSYLNISGGENLFDVDTIKMLEETFENHVIKYDTEEAVKSVDEGIKRANHANNPDVQIVVIDRRTGEVADISGWK